MKRLFYLGLFVFISIVLFAQQQMNWKDYYIKDDAKTDYIKRKEQPAFKLYKPSDDWHFIDLDKLKELELNNAKEDEKKREEVRKKYEATYCRLYREGKEAHAILGIVALTGKIGTLDDYVKQIKENLIKGLTNYKSLSDKNLAKGQVAVRMLEYEFSADKEGKRMGQGRRYVFLKNNYLWQLIIETSKDIWKDLEKEFDTLYKKFEF